MNACAVYDFRYSADIEGVDSESIINQCKKIAKRFCFQLEKGDTTGYLHYQGRMSLIKKHRKNELMKLFDMIPVPNYLEPTVNGVALTGDLFYVMKDETRQDGPWTDKFEERYIPRQYRGKMETLLPWQQVVWDNRNVFDERHINMIYCPNGNKGKSTLASLCELYGDGLDVPPVNDSKELVQLVCNMCMSQNLRTPNPVMIDLPRAMDKTRLHGIYSAVEQIKKGKLYDLRYHYKSYWIDSPQIWVFSNTRPDLEMLSADRWKIYIINDSLELVPYVN